MMLSPLTKRSVTAGSCRRCFHLALSQRTPTHINQQSIKPAIYAAEPARRCLHSSSKVAAAPKSKDRGPASKEDTQTDFAAMNVLGNTPAPTTAVDACMEDGFALNSGMKVSGAGVILAAGEAFAWRPWTDGSASTGEGMKEMKSGSARLENGKGQLSIDKQGWGVLDLLWPKPDLLILGTGQRILPLSPETRQAINSMGIRVEVQDTRNAAAQFNLLATERGVQTIAAALIPVGWRSGR